MHAAETAGPADSARGRLAGSLYVPLAAVVAIVALVGVTAWLAWRQYDDARLVAMNEARARAVLAGAVFDQYFAGDISTLESIASSPTVMLGDETALRAYLRRVQQPGRRPFTAGIGWVDAHGLSRVSSNASPTAPVDVSDRSYFKAVMRTGRPFISEGIVSRRRHQGVVVVAVPTHDGRGAVDGVLAGGIVIEPTPASQSAIDLGYAGLVILDRRNRSILTGFTKPANTALVRRLRTARTGSISDARGLSGATGRVVAWASSPGPSWVIAIDRPGGAVFAAARRALILDAVLIAALAAAIGALAAAAIVRSRRRARAQQRRLDQEHESLVKLQRTMLPERLPTIEGIEIACRYRAAGARLDVGGDWYDVVATPAGRVLAIVGDVAGRGVEAAALMGQLRSAFRAYAHDHDSPAEILRRMQRVMPEDAMATAVCLAIDPADGRLGYATAGHLPPILRAGGTALAAPAPVGGAPPLGFADPKSFADLEATLPAGSTLVAYTDGLVERREAVIDEGIARLTRLVAEAASLSAEELAARIMDDVADTSPGSRDDIALLVVKRAGEPDDHREHAPHALAQAGA